MLLRSLGQHELCLRSRPLCRVPHCRLESRLHQQVLAPGEVLTGIRFDAAPNSGFVALKQKQSFDWPMVSGYAVLDLDGDVIRSARTCAGAVAPRPRLLPAVDAALAGVSITDDAAIRKACEAATEGAAPLPGTAYKKTLLPVAIRRAVLAAANPGGDA